jgi:hypothetical protein
MALDLRPLTLGELLDRAFTLYRRHFRLFVGLMAIPSLFMLVFAVASELLQGLARNNPEALAAADPVTIMKMFVGGSVVFVVIFIAYLVAYMATLGATTVAVSELYSGREATIGSAYERMRGKVGRLMWLLILIGVRLLVIFTLGMALVFMISAGFAFAVGGTAGAAITGIGVVLGMLAIMLGCFVFALRYAVSVPALVLENVTASQAIRRSIALTRGSLGRAAMLTVFASVIAYAALFFLQGPFAIGVVMAGPGTSAATLFSLLGAVAGTIGNAITGPIMIVAMAVYYYDIRIRKEGLDLQLMVANLDQQQIAPAAAV